MPRSYACSTRAAAPRPIAPRPLHGSWLTAARDVRGGAHDPLQGVTHVGRAVRAAWLEALGAVAMPAARLPLRTGHAQPSVPSAAAALLLLLPIAALLAAEPRGRAADPTRRRATKCCADGPHASGRCDPTRGLRRASGAFALVDG